MQFKSLLPLFSLASMVAGQTVPDLATLLKNTPAVSQLFKHIGTFPDILAALTTAQNITLLAPNDAAFNAFLDLDETKEITQEAMKALLSYHVLNGTYESTAFNETPKFLPSIMGEYEPFRNLSGAPQVVKAQLEGKNATVTGGLGMKVDVVTAVSCSRYYFIFSYLADCV
jgi:transforming growth factor-beta-induced protein